MPSAAKSFQAFIGEHELDKRSQEELLEEFLGIPILEAATEYIDHTGQVDDFVAHLHRTVVGKTQQQEFLEDNVNRTELGLDDAYDPDEEDE